MSEDIVIRLRTRAAIRRGIPRPEPDRISRDCEEAADEIERLRLLVDQYQWANVNVIHQVRAVPATDTNDPTPFRPGEAICHYPLKQ